MSILYTKMRHVAEKMIKMSKNSIAVDTKEDLKKVRKIFKKKFL